MNWRTGRGFFCASFGIAKTKGALEPQQQAATNILCAQSEKLLRAAVSAPCRWELPAGATRDILCSHCVSTEGEYIQPAPSHNAIKNF